MRYSAHRITFHFRSIAKSEINFMFSYSFIPLLFAMHTHPNGTTFSSIYCYMCIVSIAWFLRRKEKDLKIKSCGNRADLFIQSEEKHTKSISLTPISFHLFLWEKWQSFSICVRNDSYLLFRICWLCICRYLYCHHSDFRRREMEIFSWLRLCFSPAIYMSNID